MPAWTDLALPDRALSPSSWGSAQPPSGHLPREDLLGRPAVRPSAVPPVFPGRGLVATSLPLPQACLTHTGR